MGRVTYSPGIQYVNGSLAKPKKQYGHSHGDYLIGTHREAPTTNPSCTRLYIRKGSAYERTSAPNSNELWARTRFAAIAAAVQARKEDLMNVNTDKQNFLAQKDDANGKKTFKAYLWSVCAAIYDEQHPRN